jgi:hypothetical protein
VEQPDVVRPRHAVTRLPQQSDDVIDQMLGDTLIRHGGDVVSRQLGGERPNA